MLLAMPTSSAPHKEICLNESSENISEAFPSIAMTRKNNLERQILQKPGGWCNFGILSVSIYILFRKYGSSTSRVRSAARTARSNTNILTKATSVSSVRILVNRRRALRTWRKTLSKGFHKYPLPKGPGY